MVTSNQISFILNTQNGNANAHLQSEMTQGTDHCSHESILIKKSALRCSLTFTGKAKQSHHNPRTARDALGLLHMCTRFKHRARNSLLHQIMSCGSCQISPSRSGWGLITNLENVIIRVKQTTSSGCLVPNAFEEQGGHARQCDCELIRCERVVRFLSVCFSDKIGRFKGRLRPGQRCTNSRVREVNDTGVPSHPITQKAGQQRTTS